MEDCIFCKIAKGEIPSNKVYEDDMMICFHDLNPQAPVHLLAIPKIHVAKLTDVDEVTAAHIGHVFSKIPEIAEKMNLGKGFRVIANCGEYAGQTVFHVHFHILGGKPFSPSF